MTEKEDPMTQLGKDSPFMRRVDFFFNRERKSLYRELTLMLIGAMIVTFIPFIIGKWMDRFKSLNQAVIDFTLDKTVLLIAALMGITLLWYILVTSGRSRYIRNIAMNKLRRHILEKIDRKDVNYVEKRSPGRYVEYISSEQQNLSRLFNSDLISVIEGLFVFTVIIILMLFTNVLLALIYMLLLPIMFFTIHCMIRSMKKNAMARQKSYVKMNTYLDDVSSDYSLMKMYGLEEHALSTFSEIDKDLSKQYRHVLYTSGYVSPMERIVENLGFIISGIIGALMLNSNMITAGMFLTFVSYSSMIGKPLANFADGLGRLRDSSISMKRIRKLMVSEEDTRHGDLDAECSDGSILFTDVNYTAANGRKILDSISFDIHYGEHIGLVGASGSGKSSIIDIMVAMHDATSGDVRYGGKDILEYEKNSLRRSISVIPSVPWISEGTVMENIRLAAPNASDEDIIRACSFIGFDRLVYRMNNGFDTVVGSNPGSMSLAERQMMSLVRLLLSNPKVVIFDDSFSGMDALTSMKIKEKMTDFLKDRTVITVSDDVADIVSSDRILFIDNGRMIEGTHDMLMSVPGYHRIMDNTV